MARKEKKYHFIYKTTNLITGRYYYGMHSTDVLNDGYMGSGKRLKYSLNKYGVENHSREILEFLPNRFELAKRESEIVNLNEISKKECMNLRTGGTGGLSGLSEDSIKNIREGASKFIFKMRENNDFILKINSLSSSRMKQNHLNGKIKYDTFRGKKHSDETKKLIGEKNSISQLGEKNSQYGKCWITKEQNNMLIIRDELQAYLNDGWKKGRYVA